MTELADMNVIILAAGTSRRLLPLTKQKPKTLLPLSKDKTMLSCIFDSLKNNGKYFSQLTVVGGHGFKFLEQEIQSLSHIVSIPPTLIFNPNYESMNNCYSLFMALENNKNRDMLVIHSDVVCDPSIVDNIIRTPHTAMVVDNKKLLTRESMKVHVANGRVTDISKGLNAKSSYGEYVGIAKVQKEHLPKLMVALGMIVKETPNLFYDDAFRSILGDVNFRVVDTNGLPWTEVDDKYDLRIARRIYKDLASRSRI